MSKYYDEVMLKRLDIYVTSAINRDEKLDNMLIYGEAGLGKTTLAKKVASMLNRNIKIVNATTIRNIMDLISILKSLKRLDVLFIDEIHSLNSKIEELLYTAIDEFKLTINVGTNDMVRTIDLDLNEFTLIGATTKIYKLSKPLKSRFFIKEELKPYGDETMNNIISVICKDYNISEFSNDIINIITKLSRGNIRLAKNLVSKVRDYTESYPNNNIDTDELYKFLGYNKSNYTKEEVMYLDVLKSKYDGGPVAVKVLAISLNTDEDTIKDIVEPYLLKEGKIKITTKGRMLIT